MEAEARVILEEAIAEDEDFVSWWLDEIAIMAARRRIGREVSKPVDAMIPAVAASRGMAVATRNTSDFIGMDVELINPWDLR